MSEERKLTLLLPSTGEPLILYCWLTNMQKYSHLFDNIFVSVDMMGRVNPLEFLFVQNYLTRLFRKFPNMRYCFARQIAQHGLNIDNMLNKYEPDINDDILLMEEDDYIINTSLLKSHINSYFEDGYNVYGVGRGSGTPYLLQSLLPMVQQRENLQIDTELPDWDSSINFWPTLFLTKKQYLLESSREFYSSNWETGDQITVGNQTLTLDQPCHGDTFVKFSYEIYNNPEINKIKLLSNTPTVNNNVATYHTYHSSLHDNDLIDSISETSVDFHVGSLSTFMSNKFWKPWPSEPYEHSYLVQMRRHKNLDSKNYENLEIVETYRRCLLMREMLKCIQDPKDFEFYDLYAENLNRTIYIYEEENDIPAILKSYNVHGMSDGIIDTNKYAKICNMVL